MSKKVIYIGGYGRSGSTILALLLGQLPNFYSSGELGVIWAALRDGRNCTCGASFQNCEFWGELVAEQYDILIKSNCSPKVGLNYIFERADNEFVIDSTKTSWRNALRPWRLNASGYTVYYVHMNRSLSGVLASAKKGKNTDLEENIKNKDNFIVLRTVLSRFIANLISYFYIVYFNKRALIVKFEQLLASPESAACSFHFLTFHQKQQLLDMIRNEKMLKPNHEINGNRLLRKSDIRFRRSSS